MVIKKPDQRKIFGKKRFEILEHTKNLISKFFVIQWFHFFDQITISLT